MSQTSISVVGAGVIGLVTALELAKEGFKVFVVAATYSAYWNESFKGENIIVGSNIVSDVAAASFIPHCADSPQNREWIAFSSQYYQKLSEETTEAGVIVKRGREILATTSRPWYLDYVSKVHTIASSKHQQSDSSNKSSSATTGSWEYETWMIEPRFFIPWLRAQLEALNVTFQKQHVSNWNELSNFDLVVNCTGLGAQELAGDDTMKPIAGQVLLLRYSGLNSWIRDSSTTGSIKYVYPQRNSVVVGGTKSGELNKNLEEVERQLKANCLSLMPTISDTPVIGINSGYRPGRSTPRVEIDYIPLAQPRKHGSNLKAVIHNYGHAGEGYCLAPGCAAHVLKLVKQVISEQTSTSRVTINSSDPSNRLCKL